MPSTNHRLRSQAEISIANHSCSMTITQWSLTNQDQEYSHKVCDMHVCVYVCLCTFILGAFTVSRENIEVAVQKGVDSWRRDTFEYFGNWDDCWARVTGALLDEYGNEINKTV